MMNHGSPATRVLVAIGSVAFFAITLQCGRMDTRFSLDSAGPNTSALTSEGSTGPSLGFRDLKIFGNGLAHPGPNGDGLLLGIGDYNLLSDRRVSPQKLRDFVCFVGDLGFNHIRTFTSLPFEPKSAWVSPWQNRSEWTSRRDIMLDAGVDCGVYIQISLFDEHTRYQGRDGFDRSDNTWNGKEPTLEVAKDLTARVYLNGLNASSPRGRVLLVEHFNEPNEDDWHRDWDERFDQWLKSQGWNTAGVAEDHEELSYWGSGDKLQMHHYPRLQRESVDHVIRHTKEMRDLHKKTPALSTDGTDIVDFSSQSRLEEMARKVISNRISFEVHMDDPTYPGELDRPISIKKWGWSGTTRSLLQYLAKITGADQNRCNGFVFRSGCTGGGFSNPRLERLYFSTEPWDCRDAIRAVYRLNWNGGSDEITASTWSGSMAFHQAMRFTRGQELALDTNWNNPGHLSDAPQTSKWPTGRSPGGDLVGHHDVIIQDPDVNGGAPTMIGRQFVYQGESGCSEK